MICCLQYCRPLLLVPYCMCLKIKIHANHCAVGLSITREIKPCCTTTPTHTHTHQQGLSQAAWCFSAAQGAAWSKHQQTFCFPPLFLFLPSSALSAALLLLYFQSTSNGKFCHWTELNRLTRPWLLIVLSLSHDESCGENGLYTRVYSNCTVFNPSDI